MSAQDKLADSLTTRLGMQISLSSLPIVEEWMDARLTRWLESVPLPVELPTDGVAEITVGVSSDLQRLTWSAYGTPQGFIPKLAKYLDASGAEPGDLGQINAIGEAFEPKYVGSWVQVVPGEVTTGWQFQNFFQLETLRAHLGESEGAEKVAGWLEARGLSVIHNLSAALGSERKLIALPLDRIDDWQGHVAAALSELKGADLPAVTDFLSANVVSRPELLIGYQGTGVETVGVAFSSVKSDDVAALCRALSVPFEADLGPLGNAMGADGMASIACIAGNEPMVEARFVPGTKEPEQAGN